MDINKFLKLKTSYQANAWGSIKKELTIKDVLEIIKNGGVADQINKLRDLIKNDKLEDYEIYKKNLPAVTFCGTFNEVRRKNFLKNYNRIIVIDIDDLDNNKFVEIKKILEKEDVVFAYWESPSRQGLKGLVAIDYPFIFKESDVDYLHKNAFEKLREYFLVKHAIQLDFSGSDTTRLCFLSFDPALTLKKDIAHFPISEINLEEKKIRTNYSARDKGDLISKSSKVYNGSNKNNRIYKKEIQFIIKFLTRNKLSITNEYENWYRVAFAIANTFTYDVGLKYFLELSKLDESKFNENDCTAMFANSYESTQKKITYKTIQYLAVKAGYKIKEKGVLR